MARSTVAVRFTGDTADLKRALGDIDGKLKSAGGKIAGFGKAAAIGLGGAAVASVALGKGFVDAAVESQKVTKQTEAVIKSMGNSAKISADSVGVLSNALSMKSGVDDELIQSGANVLLTFGNIKNEGEGVQAIFDRATSAALDMSVALGTDMTSASMMIGKALNDPVKGLAKLSRSGVQFSKEQEDQIKTMVLYGKTGEAQAIMLDELERQFGGSARAQATAGDRLKVVWGNLQEELGAKLLPVVEKVATFLANQLPRAMAVVGSAMKPVQQAIRAFTSAWSFFDGEVTSSGFNGEMEKMGFKARQVFELLKVGVQQVVAFVRQHWPQIQAIITDAVTTIQQVVSGVVATVQTLWENFGDNILEFVRRVWPSIQQTISGALQLIRGIIQTVTSLIKGDWSGVWDGLKNIVEGAFNLIVGRIKMGLELARLAVGAALEVISAMFSGAWEGIVNFFKGVPDKLKAAGSGMFDFIKQAFKGVINWVIRAWNGLEFKIPGFDPPGPGPKFGGFTLGVPNIPELATGGEVMRTGLAVVHRGERFSGTRGEFPIGSGDTYNITVTPQHESTANAVVRELRRFSLLAGN